MIYKYDSTNYEFLGAYPSNKDGNIPGGFTGLEPIEVEEGKAVVFDKFLQEWELVTDYRQIDYYYKHNGKKARWNKIDAPIAGDNLIDIAPNSSLTNPIFNTSSNEWREKTDDEVKQDKIDSIQKPTFEKWGTFWEYDLLAQWALQLGENQYRNHDNEILVRDALGTWHKLTRYKSNLLQKEMFNKYLEDAGFRG